jgi:hypothetical protein
MRARRFRLTAPLVAAARLSDPDGRWEGTLNALDANAGSRTLVSPQYVFDNDYRMVVTVVNLDDAATDLVFRLAGSEGEAVGREWTMPLQARGRIVLDDPAPSGIAPGSTLNCSLWISSSATRLAGTVLFADRDGRRDVDAGPGFPAGDRRIDRPGGRLADRSCDRAPGRRFLPDGLFRAHPRAPLSASRPIWFAAGGRPDTILATVRRIRHAGVVRPGR